MRTTRSAAGTQLAQAKASPKPALTRRHNACASLAVSLTQATRRPTTQRTDG